MTQCLILLKPEEKPFVTVDDHRFCHFSADAYKRLNICTTSGKIEITCTPEQMTMIVDQIKKADLQTESATQEKTLSIV